MVSMVTAQIIALWDALWSILKDPALLENPMIYPVVFVLVAGLVTAVLYQTGVLKKGTMASHLWNGMFILIAVALMFYMVSHMMAMTENRFTQMEEALSQ